MKDSNFSTALHRAFLELVRDWVKDIFSIYGHGRASRRSQALINIVRQRPCELTNLPNRISAASCFMAMTLFVSSIVIVSSSTNGLDLAALSSRAQYRPAVANLHHRLRLTCTRAILPAFLGERCAYGLPSATAVEAPATSLQSCEGHSCDALAQRWREYHGSNDWKGLVEPLDADLRAEILKYGDLAQLTYDAFDCDEHSKSCGDCLYYEADLLQKAGLAHTGYTVTKYIYATSDVHVLPSWLTSRRGGSGHMSSWMGFVAVTTDEEEIARLGRRDIVVAWRGTVTRLEWLEDLDGVLISPASVDTHEHNYEAVGVERGFWTLYTSSNHDAPHGKPSAAQQVREELMRLVEQYRAEKHQLSITMTGHSLGGALALLSAFHVASTGIFNKTAGGGASAAGIPVSVISFAAPRVGNKAFRHRLEEVGVKVLRVVNANDVVPKVPGIFVHDSPSPFDMVEQASSKMEGLFYKDGAHDDSMWKAYAHAGVQLLLDNRYSPFLKIGANLPDYHNLEMYLHLVDGYRSANEPFLGQHDHDDHPHHHLQLCMGLMKRDVVLVNKTSDLLLDELHVPAQWHAMKLPRPTITL